MEDEGLISYIDMPPKLTRLSDQGTARCIE